ncbi:MAG: hypothetical protein WC438_00910 [Candidatus Pacearchaeota archaeon]
MKSVLNKKDEGKRNQIILGVILLGLMIFSSLGYAFGDRQETTSQKIEYKGIIFVKDNSYWVSNINDMAITTLYNPLELENISVGGSPEISDYSNEPLYFIGGSQEANYEIVRNIGKVALRMGDACLDENCEGNYPIKNCSSDKIIIFKESDSEEKVYSEENCVYIVSSLENQTRGADAFLFKLLSI